MQTRRKENKSIFITFLAVCATATLSLAADALYYGNPFETHPDSQRLLAEIHVDTLRNTHEDGAGPTHLEIPTLEALLAEYASSDEDEAENSEVIDMEIDEEAIQAVTIIWVSPRYNATQSLE